jgi:small-conductance mechanosensitive channel
MAHIVADASFGRYDSEVKAALSLVLALATAWLVNRSLLAYGRTIAARVAGGELSPVADTRLRFLRRVIDAVIVLVGVATALSQFTALGRLADTVLASSAIAAAIVGFAARQTIANAIAGLILAITQPLRIGDHVTFEGESGVVEDVRLTSTWLRTAADARIIVPNERLAAGVLRNDSIGEKDVPVEASLWLHRDQDVVAAMDALRAGLDEVSVSVAETSSEATRLLLSGPPASPARRAAREGELREAGLRTLREASVQAGAQPA